MKKRKKKAKVKLSDPGALVPSFDRGGFVGLNPIGGTLVKVRFHDVPTSELVEIVHLENPYPDVKGRFVKVCPRILASNRQTFDGAAVAKELRELGARSVVLAPIIAADTKKLKRKSTGSQDPREIAQLWIDEQLITAEEREQVGELIFKFMDEEGM